MEISFLEDVSSRLPQNVGH